MHAFIDIFILSLSITAPIFIVLLIGTFLGRRQFIDKAFIETGSKLVFNVTLPALLFISISQSSFDQSANLKLIAVGLGGTVLTWLIIEALALKFIGVKEDRGVVVQGGFRSNMAIFGLAYCFNAYGNPGLVTASLYLAAVTILYNILSIISLNKSLNKNLGFKHAILAVLKNPLILAIVLATPLSYFNVQLPAFSLRVGEYFANMTLPLALLCIGASLDFSAMRYALNQTMLACCAKLILVPSIMMAIAIALGFRGMELGVLLFMSSAPTAAASYVMVKALGGNAFLAANIIAITTVGSLITTSASMMLLGQLGLI